MVKICFFWSSEYWERTELMFAEVHYSMLAAGLDWKSKDSAFSPPSDSSYSTRAVVLLVLDTAVQLQLLRKCMQQQKFTILFFSRGLCWSISSISLEITEVNKERSKKPRGKHANAQMKHKQHQAGTYLIHLPFSHKTTSVFHCSYILGGEKQCIPSSVDKDMTIYELRCKNWACGHS